MRRPSASVAWWMTIVGVAAVDLGLLLNRAFGANPFQIVAVLIVEALLLRPWPPPGNARARSRRLGFAAFALVYIALDARLHYEVREAVTEGYLALSTQHLPSWPLPQGPIAHGLLAAGLQVVLGILFGALGGSIAGGLIRSAGATPRGIGEVAEPPDGDPHSSVGPPPPARRSAS